MNSGYSAPASMALKLAALLVSCSLLSCTTDPVADSRALLRQEFGVSVMSVNLLDIMNIPRGSAAGVPWQTRYARIFSWMAETKNFPDVIVLQEAPGYWSCFNNARRLPDYAAIDFLLDGIRDASGEQYRIAYLTPGGPPHGPRGDDYIGTTLAGAVCTGQGDRALLYRPSKLRNVLSIAPTNETAKSAYHMPNNQTYLAKSIQCCFPAADRTDVCGVIDGPIHFPARDEFEAAIGTCGTPMGLAFTRSRPNTQTNDRERKATDAVFSRFELVKQPGHFVHIYNVHRGWNAFWEDAHEGMPAPGVVDYGSQNINQLVTDMEQRFASTGPTLYPPILVGDFNFTPPGNSNDLPAVPEGADPWAEFWKQRLLASYFPRMDVGFVSGIDGVLFGKRSDFPSKYPAYANGGQSMPVLAEGETCETASAKLWSDHCGIFFRIEPVQ